ncbi:hypothetical protein GCM10027596_26720 [Nocardioides korecus]
MSPFVVPNTITLPDGVPPVEDVVEYLGLPRATDDELEGSVAKIQSAYDAEIIAQGVKCRITPYSSDLAEALYRRVKRNLAMRNVPLGVQMDETGGTRIGSIDPEVRRLEAPYRKLVVG